MMMMMMMMMSKIEKYFPFPVANLNFPAALRFHVVEIKIEGS